MRRLAWLLVCASAGLGAARVLYWLWPRAPLWLATLEALGAGYLAASLGHRWEEQRRERQRNAELRRVIQMRVHERPSWGGWHGG
ncbi:MAG TPA: hypothetical protein VFA33_07710 [Bryobacteraceae bacterium]|nr:hypothetical protein [Bryobacteraceae bacterium]